MEIQDPALYVEVSGAGPALVLLHGWGMNAAVWDDLAAALAPTFTVHCVDLPGYGESVACVPYTLDALADVLAAALPQRLSVCGWSFGGQVALAWALRHPGQVERLVLIATPPRLTRARGWECGIDTSVFDVFAQSIASDWSAALRRFIVLQAQGGDDASVVRHELRACLLKRGKPDITALEAGLHILKDTDLRAELSRISQPCLILQGACDSIVPLGAGERLQRGLRHAVVDVFARTAHAPFIAHAKRAAQRITEFCGEG